MNDTPTEIADAETVLQRRVSNLEFDPVSPIERAQRATVIDCMLNALVHEDPALVERALAEGVEAAACDHAEAVTADAEHDYVTVDCVREGLSRMSDVPMSIRSNPEQFGEFVLDTLPAPNQLVQGFFAYVAECLDHVVLGMARAEAQTAQRLNDLCLRLGLSDTISASDARAGTGLNHDDLLAAPEVEAERVSTFLEYLDDQIDDARDGEPGALTRIVQFLEYLDDELQIAAEIGRPTAKRMPIALAFPA